MRIRYLCGKRKRSKRKSGRRTTSPEPRSSRYLPGEEDEPSEEESLWDAPRPNSWRMRTPPNMRSSRLASSSATSFGRKRSSPAPSAAVSAKPAAGAPWWRRFCCARLESFLRLPFFLSGGYNSLTLGILSFLLIGVIWLVPRQGMKMRARALADGKNIHASIYP